MRTLALAILLTNLASALPLPFRTTPATSSLQARRPQIVALIQAHENAALDTIHHWHPDSCTAQGVTCAER